MDNLTTASNSSTFTDTPKLKPPKKRIRKLTAAEIFNLPGALAAPEKKVEPDLAYFIIFMLPVTGLIGTTAEAAQDHDFAHKLDEQAKAKDVGAVMSVGVSDGVFEVVLKLTATGEQPSHGAPTINAFTQLKEFLDAAPQLKPDSSGKHATWKAKVNGTTIVDGRY